MKVRVKRAFYGDEKGVKAGDVIEVAASRGKELAAKGLVEIISAEEKEAENPENKQAPTPRNKQVGTPETKGDALREDGPTIAEFISAGYPAANYPPHGYASRSTPEEIADAVAAEKAKASQRDPLDHDGDGKKGGSLPKSQREAKD